MEKKNNGVIFGLILFIVISLILGGYIVYEKLFVKESSNQEKSGEEIQNIDDNLVKYLYSYVSIDLDEDIRMGENFFGYNDFYKSDVLSQDIPDEDKMYLAYRQLKLSDLVTKECPLKKVSDNSGYGWCGHRYYLEGEEPETIYTTAISGEIFDQKMKSIFGQNVNYNKNTSFYINQGTKYFYDEQTDMYYLSVIEGGGTHGPEFRYRRYKEYEVKDNDIIITEEFANVNTETCAIVDQLTPADETNIIQKLNDCTGTDKEVQKRLDEKYSEIKDNLRTVKYVFKKDNNGNYYFYESILEN